MKVLKNSEQKNVIVDKDYYTHLEISVMLALRETFFLTKDFEVCYSFEIWKNEGEKELRIFLSDVDELKVKYSKKYGEYQTVAITKDGEELIVKL